MAKCPNGHLLPSALGAWPMALAAIRKLDEPSDLIWFLSSNKELQECGKKWWTTWCTKWLQSRIIVNQKSNPLFMYSPVGGRAQMHFACGSWTAQPLKPSSRVSPDIWSNDNHSTSWQQKGRIPNVYPSMATTYWNDITTVSQRTTCPTLPKSGAVTLILTLWPSIQPNKSRRKVSQENPSSTRPVPQAVKEPLGGRCCETPCSTGPKLLEGMNKKQSKGLSHASRSNSHQLWLLLVTPMVPT